MRSRRVLNSLLVVLIAGAAATALHGAVGLREDDSENAAMIKLAQGHDVAVAGDADGPLLAARALLLLKQGKTDEVRAMTEHMSAPALAPQRALILYDLGNDSLREAMAIYMQVPLRQVKPLINAAKANYRQSLQLVPGNWDCRYNYALASTLIRDTETANPMLGAQMSHDKSAWPDIPGAPNGMP